MEKCRPNVVHIVGVDKDTVDTIPRLNLTDNAGDLITWGEKNKRLEYGDVQMANMCMFISESNFEEDSFDNNVLITMLDRPYQS